MLMRQGCHPIIEITYLLLHHEATLLYSRVIAFILDSSATEIKECLLDLDHFPLCPFKRHTRRAHDACFCTGRVAVTVLINFFFIYNFTKTRDEDFKECVENINELLKQQAAGVLVYHLPNILSLTVSRRIWDCGKSENSRKNWTLWLIYQEAEWAAAQGGKFGPRIFLLWRKIKYYQRKFFSSFLSIFCLFLTHFDDSTQLFSRLKLVRLFLFRFFGNSFSIFQSFLSIFCLFSLWYFFCVFFRFFVAFWHFPVNFSRFVDRFIFHVYFSFFLAFYVIFLICSSFLHVSVDFVFHYFPLFFLDFKAFFLSIFFSTYIFSLAFLLVFFSRFF